MKTWEQWLKEKGIDEALSPMPTPGGFGQPPMSAAQQAAAAAAPSGGMTVAQFIAKVPREMRAKAQSALSRHPSMKGYISPTSMVDPNVASQIMQSLQAAPAQQAYVPKPPEEVQAQLSRGVTD